LDYCGVDDTLTNGRSSRALRLPRHLLPAIVVRSVGLANGQRRSGGFLRVVLEVHLAVGSEVHPNVDYRVAHLVYTKL
jgi:hypothetical protein